MADHNRLLRWVSVVAYIWNCRARESEDWGERDESIKWILFLSLSLKTTFIWWWELTHGSQMASPGHATHGWLPGDPVWIPPPYSGVSFPVHRLIWRPSQTAWSDSPRHPHKVNTVDQALRALLVSFWVSPTWAHACFPIKTPICSFFW